MTPPLFELLVADAGITAVFGTLPTRIYPIEAPGNVSKPYAVFQTIFGSPENNLNERPNIDFWSIQIDVFSDDIGQLRDAAEAMRDALELHAHITSWDGDSRDFATKLFKYSFTVEFWHNREPFST